MLLALGARIVSAQDVESLHLLNAFFKPTEKLTLQAHMRVRTNNDLSSFFQARGGPIATYALRPRFSLIGGYYYIGQENTRRTDVDQFHRAFGGGQVTLVKNQRMTLEARTLVERFVATPTGDFTRARQRFLFQKQGQGILPYLSVEGLVARNRGTVRVGAGITRQISPQMQMSMGYEMRQYQDGHLGHILVTNLQFVQQRRR